jgi:hypothetical protein
MGKCYPAPAKPLGKVVWEVKKCRIPKPNSYILCRLCLLAANPTAGFSPNAEVGGGCAGAPHSSFGHRHQNNAKGTKGGRVEDFTGRRFGGPLGLAFDRLAWRALGSRAANFGFQNK